MSTPPPSPSGFQPASPPEPNVITSYSIHYTKLYDLFLSAWLKDLLKNMVDPVLPVWKFEAKGCTEKPVITSYSIHYTKLYEAQIEKAPKSGGLHIILANLYLGDKKTDEALALYTKAQELDPNNPQPYAMSALILGRQGKTDQAIAEYKDLLAKQPKAIGAYMGLGSIYDQTGKSELARDAYKKALDINPEFV